MTREETLAALRSSIESITAREDKPAIPHVPDGTLPERPDPARQPEADGVGGECIRPAAPKALNQDEPSRALNKVIELVNVSDRSERAVRERLAKHGFGPAAIDEAVERSKEYGFIDDLRYADVLIRSRVSQGKGSAGIERELIENGIDPNDVPGWPYEFDIDHDQELDRAIAFLERKPPRSKNPREGAFRKLVQRGFPVSVASSAARIWSVGKGC